MRHLKGYDKMLKGHDRLRALLKDGADDDAAASVDDPFRNVQVTSNNKEPLFHELSELVVLADKAGVVFVDLSNDEWPRIALSGTRIALTGISERDNHCTLPFKRPFRSAHCDVYMEA